MRHCVRSTHKCLVLVYNDHYKQNAPITYPVMLDPVTAQHGHVSM